VEYYYYYYYYYHYSTMKEVTRQGESDAINTGRGERYYALRAASDVTACCHCNGFWLDRDE